MDFLVLILLALLAMAFTALAFLTRQQRFIPTLIGGVLWFALGFYVLESDVIFSLCSIGMGFYMLVRSVWK